MMEDEETVEHDPLLIDEVAIERALQGDPVALTEAERDEVTLRAARRRRAEWGAETDWDGQMALPYWFEALTAHLGYTDPSSLLTRARRIEKRRREA